MEHSWAVPNALTTTIVYTIGVEMSIGSEKIITANSLGKINFFNSYACVLGNPICYEVAVTEITWLFVA